MDNKANYFLSIDIPFNEETSRAYSDDPPMSMSYAEHIIQRIKLILRKESYISLNRIFRTMEMREQLGCPTIFFDTLIDWSFGKAEDGNGYILSLCMGNFEFDILPVIRKETPKTSYQSIAKEKKHLRIVKNESEEEPPWDQDGTGQKETSESGENGET